jgi:hypothetical protein
MMLIISMLLTGMGAAAERASYCLYSHLFARATTRLLQEALPLGTTMNQQRQEPVGE